MYHIYAATVVILEQRLAPAVLDVISPYFDHIRSHVKPSEVADIIDSMELFGSKIGMEVIKRESQTMYKETRSLFRTQDDRKK